MIVYRSIDSSCNQNYLASRFINDSLRNVYLPRALDRFISQAGPHHAKKALKALAATFDLGVKGDPFCICNL